VQQADFFKFEAKTFGTISDNFSPEFKWLGGIG
jgi:hypothetical protein